MLTMIYHAPYALDPTSVSASAIRPVTMWETFRSLGIEVLDITGNAKERQRQFRAVKRRVAAGQRIDFMYSENATIPPMVTEPRHVPPHFFLDLSIMRFCASHNIPVGVFYRDIYWKFDEYDERVPEPLATVMKALYRYELWGYSRWCSKIFLPSRTMGKYLPQLDQKKCIPLPPGGRITRSTNTDRTLSVFYIGGIGGHYRLHHLCEAVSRLPQVKLMICTDRSRWESVKDEYPQVSSPNISVVHKSGDERDELYRQANVCYVAMEPEPYGAFASPVKLYEYIGRGKPILAIRDTLVATVVSDNDIGWVTENSVEAFLDILTQLADHPEEVERARNTCETIRENHTWEMRARRVIRELTGHSDV
ncbi:MAG: glycosyltransferase [Actinomycetaceae bacterium]|nr:glycosyltransferase [Actinomycetaceae bacterium]